MAGNETKRVEPKRKKFKMEKLEAKFFKHGWLGPSEEKYTCKQLFIKSYFALIHNFHQTFSISNGGSQKKQEIAANTPVGIYGGKRKKIPTYSLETRLLAERRTDTIK